jgi:tRNA 2-selenouridine synthase
VQLLLEHYYDPRYEHATNQYDPNRITIKVHSMDEAIDAIVGNLKKLNN